MDRGADVCAAHGPGGLRLTDVLAAAYGDFDAVHLLGLVEGEWPAAPVRNIFFPVALLRELAGPVRPIVSPALGQPLPTCCTSPAVKRRPRPSPSKTMRWFDRRHSSRTSVTPGSSRWPRRPSPTGCARRRHSRLGPRRGRLFGLGDRPRRPPLPRVHRSAAPGTLQRDGDRDLSCLPFKYFAARDLAWTRTRPAMRR